jgi:hypothetical protein
MIAPWWDELHWTMWRLADRSSLLPVVEKARHVAREVVVPLLASGARYSCEWTPDKSQLIAALDANGLNSIVSTAGHGIATPLALAAWELAWVDGGAAANTLSGSMAQMPILDFGTSHQREQYLGRDAPRHGALCLTEPIPGAGSDALFLTGSFHLSDGLTDGERTLHVEKRGRFISHMDFADFVVAAVQARGDHVRGSCLVILEPEDTGEFDRGARVHKVGHQLSSTTNPSFSLRIPASRIIGGYTLDNGVLVPNIDHRRALSPAFRRTRAILSLMTASKLLSTVESFVHSNCQLSEESQFCQSMAELWAIGEAAASLGFAAARVSDDLDRAENPSAELLSRCAVLSPAAKLFSTSRVPAALQSVAILGERWAVQNAFALQDRLADAQIEAVQMGPEALQRRQLSVAMIDGHFLREFYHWTDEIECLARKRPHPMLLCLAAGMRLWQWTLNQLQQQTDTSGRRLYSDARQGVTFAMADALCGLLAARSFVKDILELEECKIEGAWAPSIMSNLAAIASLRGAGSTRQISADLLFGYDCHFSPAARSELNSLRNKLDVSISGTLTARARAEHFLLGLSQSHGKAESLA